MLEKDFLRVSYTTETAMCFITVIKSNKGICLSVCLSVYIWYLVASWACEVIVIL